MKYRYLTDQELEILEKDFVHFLVANGIDNDEWVRVNAESKEKALEIVGLFSDVVIEKAIENIKYLEYRSAKSLKIFHCKEKEISLIGLDIDEESNLDFTEADSAEKAMAEGTDAIKTYKTKKAYHPSRTEELFKMMEAGCYIVDGKFYNTLNHLRKVYQN
tara:strand:- start:3997 stop:4479 length:483 start_codon:yes stop_codon:yes gene_type:complete